MSEETPSDREGLAAKEFKVEHYLALWQHYENRGSSDKDRMVTVVTWLLAFAAAILGFTATKFDFSAWSFTEKGLAVVGSVVGLVICLLGTCLVVAFAVYADRNFQRADRIKDDFTDLREVVNSAPESPTGWIFRRLGILFDAFLLFSFIGVVLSVLVIAFAALS